MVKPDKKTPKPLTMSEIAQMYRKLIGDLENNDNLLKTVGLLRLAGQESEIKAIIQKRVLPDLKEENIHNALNAAKRAFSKEIKSDEIQKMDPQGVQSFRKAFNSMMTASEDQKEEKTKAAMEAYQQLIKKLVISGDLKKLDLAEALYSHLHLGAMIAQQNSVNLMRPENCAIVLGPGIADVFQLSKDPLQMLTALSNINELVKRQIESGDYDLSFNDYQAGLVKTKTQKLTDEYKGIAKAIYGLNEQLSKLNANPEKTEQLKIQIRQIETNIKSLEQQKAEKYSQLSDLKQQKAQWRKQPLTASLHLKRSGSHSNVSKGIENVDPAKGKENTKKTRFD